MLRQFELVERVKHYDTTADEDALNRAYVFAMMAHGTQTRASGDPYYSHPVEVAGILADMKLDGSSIITGLLHDTVEDTDTTLDDISGQFGDQVAQLVDGVTKLSRIELQSEDSRQAENFRKLFLAMSEDIRVLLVKLADRLHNMRTLHHIKKDEKRLRVARETMEIYAPLAERIGMQALKDELEDLAFREINPSARASIVERLRYLREGGGDLIPRIVDRLKKTLKQEGSKAEVCGREKRPYSIWRKMQRKNITFEQLSDIVAFRVLLDDPRACYAALGVIHSAWPMVPGRFKDYISTPKPNGYRSLHTTVYGPEHHRLEIQIRTREMDDIAQFGVAAHWSYQAGEARASLSDGRQYRWVRELLEILDHASDPEEFLEHTKLEMFQDQVFCFTPKGDLIALPRGATPVDFAYAVHTDIGDTCVGAKINGKINQLRMVLHNGDQVEIVRSSVASPSPTWERFVVTGRARSHIRRFVRLKERDEYIRLGEAILERAFAQARCDMTKKALKHVCGALGQKTARELFDAVGRGEITSHQVVGAAYPEAVGGAAATPRARPRDDSAGDHAIPIRGLIPGMAVHFSNCCHPLPGDRIVGIVTSGKGVAIHTIDCDMLQQFEATPERWLDVSWTLGEDVPEVHVGRIDVIVVNEPGALGTITTLIGRNNGNISNLKFTNRAADFFEMRIDVEVRDVRHLTNIIAALRANPVVTAVERAKT
ncbi:MAG: bifunctional (p)ppGpp synthetase/guanosine-3',5'-bis(diphosphate) 3'-pyrophosphohydrolase [Rhodospirillales bacterium]|nr:bifunctional (p)ppGpp synthetase/guanosine-3',5'-bis(diphosphate) 3'-pyrophosphohydrolase [Rhodospirillales bacterium]